MDFSHPANRLPGFHTEFPQQGMSSLPVHTLFYQSHQNPLHCRERSKISQGPIDSLCPYLQSLNDLRKGFEDLIDDQEGFRQYAAPVGTVIQGAFQDRVGIIVPGDCRATQITSARERSIFSTAIGLRLKGMAEDPTCSLAKGSDTSPIG